MFFLLQEKSFSYPVVILLIKDNSSLRLNTDYVHYCQVQTKTCEVEYAIVVLCGEEGMFVKRIVKFIDNAVDKTGLFIKLVILSELLENFC